MMSAEPVQKKTSSHPLWVQTPKATQGAHQRMHVQECGAAYVRPTCTVYVRRSWWMVYVTTWLQLFHSFLVAAPTLLIPFFLLTDYTHYPASHSESVPYSLLFICAPPLHHSFCFFYPLPLSIDCTVPQYGHTSPLCLLFTFLRLWFRIPFFLDYKLTYLLSSIFLLYLEFSPCFPLFSFCTRSSLHALGALASFPRAVALPFMLSRRPCAWVSLLFLIRRRRSGSHSGRGAHGRLGMASGSTEPKGSCSSCKGDFGIFGHKNESNKNNGWYMVWVCALGRGSPGNTLDRRQKGESPLGNTLGQRREEKEEGGMKGIGVKFQLKKDDFWDGQI